MTEPAEAPTPRRFGPIIYAPVPEGFWANPARPGGSSFSALPPEAWHPGYTFGVCVAVPSCCNGICPGLCSADDEPGPAP